MGTTSQQPSAPRRPRSLAVTLILAGTVIGYSLLQPKLENWFGDQVPSARDQPIVHTLPPFVPTDRATTTPGDSDRRSRSERDEYSAASPSDTAAGDPPSSTTAPPANAKRAAKSPTAKLGELRDIGGNVFRSTAGLHYRPGSQEGHRIKHILRHHEDHPDRPVHGVFDGDRNEVFAVIDEAYLYTFDHGPPRVTTEKDDGRTIYRVDLGRRIGYVGGQSGRRQGHPAARHVQLILEGTNVITAYPVRGRQ